MIKIEFISENFVKVTNTTTHISKIRNFACLRYAYKVDKSFSTEEAKIEIEDSMNSKITEEKALLNKYIF